MFETWVMSLHLVACFLLAMFGLQRAWLLWVYFRCRGAGQAPVSSVPPPHAGAPIVTVQLPIYNEKNVCTRLIDAVCALDYPKSKLEIQVLDDSTDETRTLVAECVAAWSARGFCIAHLTRSHRHGFKAGALAAGLATARGEYIAIFDADFLPAPSFLRQILPAFSAREIGMVQARWGHLNRRQNWLTRAQSLFLDAHFSVEHVVRHRARHFFNFNGTAGVWRKTAIEAAGGWDATTLTEDLDLSFRAQLSGCRFVYLDDVEVAAELPAEINGFKGQQHRWAKGSIQTARRLLPRIWATRLPFRVRLDATCKLLQNFGFLWLAALLFTMPMVAVWTTAQTQSHLFLLEWSALMLATLPVCVEFLLAQRIRRRAWLESILQMPLALGVGAALSLHNAKAVLEGLFGWGAQTFVRTPKKGAENRAMYPAKRSPTALAELALGGCHLGVALWLIASGEAHRAPFLLWFGLSLASFGAGALGRDARFGGRDFFVRGANPRARPHPATAEK